MDHLEKGTLDLSELRFLVLDEADEMLKMGFAEDVETILADTPEDKHVALFSATMPPQIRRISKKYLTDAAEITVKSRTTTAANTTQRYLQVAHQQKLDALTRILEVENFEGMIVFVRTKQVTEQLAERLRARGFSAAAINGDIVQAQRERTINQLREAKLDILVATDVAARGLDVERISHVVNYDIPTDTESYVHRIGRTGRAGRTGDAISFITPRERHLLRAIEKATRQPLTPMRLPTVEDVNLTRVARFTDSITTALGSSQLAFFRDLVTDYEQEHDVPAADVAAALAVLAPGRPAAADGPRAGAPAPVRRTSGSGRLETATRSRAAGATAPAWSPGAPAPPRGAATCRWRRTASPWASGTRWSRGRSSARSPTRAGSAARTSGTSTSAATTRSSSCRRTCPPDTYAALERTRISGRLIALTLDGAPGGRKRRS